MAKRQATNCCPLLTIILVKTLILYGSAMN